MDENEITGKMTAALRKSANAVVFKVHGHAMQQPGIPDFYIAHPLFTGWIEAKGRATFLAPLQKKIIRDLRAAGAAAYVLRYMSPTVHLITDEEENLLAKYMFTKWNEGASLLLGTLHGLGANSTVQSITP